jgi:hypothetical protein
MASLVDASFGSATNDSSDLTAFVFSNVGVFGLKLPAEVTAAIEFSVDLMNWEVMANGANGVYEDTDAFRNGSVGGDYRAKQ